MTLLYRSCSMWLRVHYKMLNFDTVPRETGSVRKSAEIHAQSVPVDENIFRVSCYS